MRNRLFIPVCACILLCMNTAQAFLSRSPSRLASHASKHRDSWGSPCPSLLLHPEQRRGMSSQQVELFMVDENAEPEDPEQRDSGLDPEAFITDEAMLEKWRLARQQNNDRWQSKLFGEHHAETFHGEWVMLKPNNDWSLVPKSYGTVEYTVSSKRQQELWERHSLKETFQGLNIGFDPPYMFQPLHPELSPESFRSNFGSMVVGGAMTFAKREGHIMVCEIGVREKEQRMRCRFSFRPNSAHFELSSVVLMRELTPKGQALGLKWPTERGGGIYDAQPTTEDYRVLSMPGLISIMYPLRIFPSDNKPHVLSLDWTAGDMRYQVDRKFTDMDGSLKTLELTEIQPQDAEKYPAAF